MGCSMTELDREADPFRSVSLFRWTNVRLSTRDEGGDRIDVLLESERKRFTSPKREDDEVRVAAMERESSFYRQMKSP